MSANTTSSGVQGELLFSVSKNIPTNIIEDTTDNNDIIEEDSVLSDQSAVLCIIHKNGKMAAAYYRIYERMLYFLREIIDLPPEYSVTRSLLREINPLHIVTIGSPRDDFIKSLINIINNQDAHTTIDTDESKTIPNNISIVSFKEFTYNTCEYKVKSIHLQSEPEGLTETERELYMYSLINFQSKLSVYALGALVKFIEKSWTHLRGADDQALSFHHINQITLEDHVFIDRTTFNALQVFQVMTHDARFKQGRMSTSREGVSLYRLFSQHCRSKIGYFELKHLLLKPIKNIHELNKRLDFIEFVQMSKHQGFVEILQENIRHIGDINMILGKIQHARASRNDWHILYKTIYHILFLNELCTSYTNDSSIFLDLVNSVSEDLYGLERSIDSALDFKTKVKRNHRPIIKEGLDTALDKNKMMRDDISKHVTAAGKVVINQLPEFLQECTVFYIPDMGHVVAIKKWEPNCDYNELQIYGFQFMFELNDNLHYKNALCQELDNHLGDIQTEIISHENRIVERVAAFVIRYNNHIRRPMRIVALIDCLISMAKVAADKGYVRPMYNDNNIIEIQNGRHPLLELVNQNYVKNSFYSGGPYPHMKIITGPNASGKSVYLKQTTLLIYLAHIGSFIPADSANISMVHSIHSRIHATESALLHLSAFMIDLTQMSQALYNAKPSSLVIMDEFGRGTTGIEGSALLTGALRKFLSQGECCPHVMVSTHMEPEIDLLESQYIEYNKMDHTRDPNTNNIVFLYEVSKGISSSYALEIAASVDLNTEIVLRGEIILDGENTLRPLVDILPEGYQTPYKNLDVQFFKDIEIPPMDE